MLGREGRLNFIPVTTKEDVDKVAEKFVPYTPLQLRTMLLSEYSQRYDISVSDGFVVVHPWGDRTTYLNPFETLQERFQHFFESNGIELETPIVPMIAVVLRSRNDFDRYLINEVEIHDSRIGGYYSRITNRTTTYDPAGKLRHKNDKWLYDANPVIHEATHQSAFNMGIHNRFAPPPKWLSEGLATLFETKGFNHSSKFPKLGHRINTTRLRQLRKYLNPGKLKASLLHMIASDQIFEANAELAYSLSWGLSLYMFENHKEKYFEFLLADAKRKNFSSYSPSQRLKNFANSFGNDIERMESDLIKMYKKK